jgi:ATP-binding cassette subfamily B protein
LSFHDERGTADSLHRLQHDTSSIYTFAVDGVIPFLTAACTIAAMFYVSLRIDWQLTLIAVAVCPFLVVLARVYGRVLRRTARESKRLETDAYTVMHESLAALRVVKAFGQENREEKRFVSRSLASIRARVRMAVQSGTFGVLIGLTIACGTAAVLLIGVWHVRSGTLTLGSLLLVIGYLAQLYGPLRILSTKLTGMQKYFANAERVFSLLDEAPEVIDYPHAHRLDRAQGAVSFNNVTFAYEADVPILESAGFAVEAGTCVGIVGTTGHGKTTLLNLLPRFFDPDSGSIALDGVDIRNYRLADLRRQFAIVLQDSVLFSTSISENISYARPDATEAEIVKAAQAANAHGFIMDMPQGYETRVGERGMRLSGGERQRIALARAFLMDAPLLLLDEPTSAVDVRTEAEILSIIDRLAAGRTTFMVSHRLSALKNCSMLLHVEHGRVTVRPPEFVDSLS